MALKLTLMSLASLPLAQSESVLGVYIFHRHGDRTPKSHAPANLTSLGAEEVFLSGSYYRSRYVASDASSPIRDLSHDIAVQSQLSVTAPDDAVLHNSAQVFVQGLYPPVGRLSAQALANGTEVEAPLGGYQYVPVKAVASSASSTRADAENNEWLQGGSGCGNAMVSSNNYFASSEYQKTYSDSKAFYQGLLPVISGTFDADEANFKNGYTIFDLINAARIHNKTIPSSDLLTPETVAKVQDLANIHEWNLAFNESEPIRAIAGSVLAGQILQQLQSALDGKSKSTSPLGIQFGAYASFSSFFGLAQLQKLSADFTGIVDYASSMAFELVTNSTSSPVSEDDVSVRFLFSNGAAGAAGNVPVAYPLFGRSEVLLPWSAFAGEMNKFAIGDTKSWCTACGNSTGQCAQYASGSSSGGDATAASKSGNGISTAVAGVIGALVTLVVILGIEGLVYALAGLRLVKKSSLAAQATKVEVSGASKA
ncbi:histidine acid phosphatase [Apiospora hydei]|uniref:Histidine acid phosphatase n=1 Tax=Apiospora hydei TaxID=1337664 RepID=A0ABR1X290_9PEZI